jgi:V/A-type H+-transporting ATPase subunit I
MIVPMKKLYMIVQKKDIVSSLESLRELGAVHIEALEATPDAMIVEYQEEIKALEEASAILSTVNHEGTQESVSDWREVVNLVLKKQADIDHLREHMAKREALIEKWTPWGHFSMKDTRVLAGRGVYLQLYELTKAQMKDLPKDKIRREIYSSGGITRIAVFNDVEESLPFKQVELHSRSLNSMNDLQRQALEKIGEAQRDIDAQAKYLAFLQDQYSKSQDSLNFENVAAGMKEDETLAYLKGFCPTEDAERIEKEAQKNNWGILIEDPVDNDEVPTLLKNKGWFNLSSPVIQLVEVLPGYKEADVSGALVIFFTLFFGMLIGDAAYGAIFALMTGFAHFKLGKKMEDKTLFYLMYLLTGFTMVWGVLTGTYFGQQWLPSTVSAVVPWLNVTENIQWLCFTIAVVHLSLARIWSAARKFPNMTYLSDIGWLFIVFGMYHLANMFVLNIPLPQYAAPLIFIGMALAFFFMVPFKEFTKQAPQEAIPFLLGVISSGTDIVSYIRLFAVGLATVAVADAANNMPAALPDFGIGYGFMVFLHVLNLVLAAMAILVHAIRLNVLEFSGHLGLEWSGFKFQPFKRNVKQV